MSERFKEKINSLIEQRIMEATKKQITQKLLCVSKYLGRKITAQSMFADPLRDHWQTDEDLIYDPNHISTNDPDDWTITDRGFYFDGLKCGINLCVTVLLYDDKVSELKATYNGYLVYAEIEGEVKAYAPFPAWENALDMFHEAAVQVEKKRMMEHKEIRQEDNRQKMQSFWQKFRMLWGF